MPLARAALYGMGIDVYVAPTWDNSDEWVPTLRHIAKEGRCWVIGATPCIRGSDIPAEIPGRDAIYGGDEDWLSRGNSVIVAPGGRIVAGPLVEQEGSSGCRPARRRCRPARSRRVRSRAAQPGRREPVPMGDGIEAIVRRGQATRETSRGAVPAGFPEPCVPGHVGPVGIEPTTFGLKVRCSTD